MKKKILLTMLLLLWATQVFAQVYTAWVRRYNDQSNRPDWPYAIALDASGNIYVSGYSMDSATSADYATVKYRPSGDTAWVRRYNGPANDWDQVSAMAVDNRGNVYVTGYSAQSSILPYNQDYATIKYDSSGNELWVKRYNGSANGYDYAYAIAVDTFGNVYVTGKGQEAETNADYTTIKYLPNGDTAWVRRYNGLNNSYDEAHAITVDDSGYVYVTGYADEGGSQIINCTTVKYTPNGNVAWVRSYNNGLDYGKDIAVDELHNVYVTGYSGMGASYDYITIKYRPNGDTAWARRYNGPANEWDEAVAIALDDFGNVYVSGFSFGTGTYRDYLTIKYDSIGTELWVKRYNGPGNNTDEPRGLAVDVFGNVYVTGFSSGDGTTNDYATVKYNPAGDEIWVVRYNGFGEGTDEASGVVVDDSSYVYVTGYSWGNGTAGDYTTIKYVQVTLGDANGDGVVDVGDVVWLINYLYKNGPPPVPLEAGDANGDDSVDVGDVIYLINYLFKGGPPPSC
jgi:uncharacterized delta-60 repeat protein